MCLIEAIAFLHQHQREQGHSQDGKPYVLASAADYRLAYDLARDVLASTLHELSHDCRELWEKLVPFVTQRAPKSPLDLIFTLKDVRQAINLPNHRLRQAMGELVDMEYVALVVAQNGRQFQYNLLTLEVQAATLGSLTHPDELERLLASA